MDHTERPRPVRRGSVTGALILIVVGFIWLLHNLGYLPGDIWYSLWRFWPVILILLGADIALRGFSTWFALPVLILVVVVVVGAVLLVAPTFPTKEMMTDDLSQELGALSEADILMELDNGTLHVERLDENPHLLMKGHFIHNRNIFIQQEFTESSGLGNLTLADRYEAFFPFFFLGGMRNDWTVELTPRIALQLEFDGSDCRLDLNLSDLALKTFVAELDDCTGKVEMPASDKLDATLNLDDTELTVIVPASAAASVRLDLDDTELTVDSSRFDRISGNEYLSQGYDEAETRLDLMLTATHSSISIQ